MEMRWLGSVGLILILVLLVFAVGYSSGNSVTGYPIFSKVFSKNKTQQARLNLSSNNVSNYTINNLTNYTINNLTNVNFTIGNISNSNFTIFNFTKSNLTIGNVSNSNIVINGTRFNITINSRLYRF